MHTTNFNTTMLPPVRVTTATVMTFASVKLLPALFATMLALFVLPSTAHADPPPKVCVVIAGDPDPTVRSVAQSVTTQSETRTDVRIVSDAITRSVLLGESVQDPSLTTLAELRRGLTSSERDNTNLNSIGERLGCALVVQVSARPVGFRIRLFDVVHQRFASERDVTNIASNLAEEWIVPAAVQAVTVTATPPTQVTLPAPGQFTTAGLNNVTTPTPNQQQQPPSTPQNPHPATPPANRGPVYWPWIVAGGAALLLIGGFIILQNPGPEHTVISVRHQAITTP